ncbi:DUF6233 domain-containing protein [Streptomyces sp. NPDC054766]
MRVYHAMWLQRIDAKIAALQDREAEQERGRRNRPEEPDWVVELGIGNGRPPIEVHVGGCYAAGKRRPAARDRRRLPRVDEVGRQMAGHLDSHPSGPPELPRPTGQGGKVVGCRTTRDHRTCGLDQGNMRDLGRPGRPYDDRRVHPTQCRHREPAR